MAKKNGTVADINDEIRSLKERIAELEGRAAQGRPISATAVALNMLNAKKVRPIIDEVSSRSILREEKEAAKKLIDDNLAVLNLTKDDYKYSRLIRDINRAETVERLDDLINDIKVEVELDRNIAAMLIAVKDLPSSDYFARCMLRGKLAMAGF